MGGSSSFTTELFTVSRLLGEVAEGRVRVPFFQRGFVWNDADRLQLFDSIAKGYPIGTLLLAKGHAPAGVLKLGSYQLNVSTSGDALWVIDGQQRLSTLAMSLLGDFTGAHRPIFYDLEQRVFTLGPRKRTAPATWVPASVLSSARTLNPWLREAALGNELNDHADAITATLREYTIPAYVVPYSEDDRVAKEIFARINRRGRALTRQEVFDALHTDGAGMKPLERVDASLARLGFGSPGVHVIERAAVALLGRAPGALPQDLSDIAPDPSVLFADVERALARAVEFLAVDADVPHAAWLPYDGVLPTLARFFALHPEAHPRNRELLARWFWRGTLSGNLATNNALDGHRWKAIVPDEHQSVQSLLRLLPRISDEHRAPSEPPYRRGTARAKVELLSLYALGPRRLVGDEQGALLEPSSLLAEQEGAVRAELPWFMGSPGAGRTLSGAILHPKVSVESLREVPWSAALHGSHAISERAWTHFVQDDLDGFERARRDDVEAQLRRFLDSHLGFDLDDHDRPPLDLCLVEESA